MLFLISNGGNRPASLTAGRSGGRKRDFGWVGPECAGGILGANFMLLAHRFHDFRHYEAAGSRVTIYLASDNTIREG